MNISHKMILYFSILFIVIITMIGTVTYQFFSSSIRDQIVQDTGKIMDQTIKNVDFYFSDIKTPMIMLARNPNISYAFKFNTMLDWPERLDLSRNIRDITGNITEFKSYINDIILVGNNGYTYSTSNSNQFIYQYDFWKADWFQQAVSESKPGFNYITTHVSDYYASGSPGSPLEKVVTALLAVKEDNVELGYVLCDIKVRKLNEIFGNLFLGQGGFVYMMDDEGTILFHPDEKKVGTRVSREIAGHVQDKKTDTFVLNDRGQETLVILARSDVTHWILAGEIPYGNITKSATRLRSITYLIMAAGIVLVIIVSILISKRITRPLKLIIDRIKQVQIQRFETKQADYGKGEIGLLGGKLETMIMEIDRLIKDVYLSELKKKEAVLKMLQSQIQPHFLYNTLQLIKTEAFFGNKQEVSSIITSLGELLRYTLYNHDQPATIAEELQNTIHFLDITKKRFGNKFNYFCEADSSLEAVKLPKLVIQPIVENCMVHGLANMKANGIIRITVHKADEDTIKIHIFDNGKGMDPLVLDQLNQKLHGRESIGLANVNERMILQFGPAYGLRITSEPGQFTNVELTLPAKEQRNA